MEGIRLFCRILVNFTGRTVDDSSKYECFMRLFLPAQRGLYGYLRTIVPNRADAEDVLQATATVLWEKFDDFKPDTRFDYWAYSIARFQAMRFLKERKRSRLVFSDDVLSIIADRASAVSAGANETMDSLEICVDRLADSDRELLRMRFDVGATNRSVANSLGRPERTVSRLLSRLYANLLECIQHRTSAKQQRDMS